MILNQEQIDELKEYFNTLPRGAIVHVINSDILNLIETIENLKSKKYFD